MRSLFVEKLSLEKVREPDRFYQWTIDNELIWFNTNAEEIMQQINCRVGIAHPTLNYFVSIVIANYHYYSDRQLIIHFRDRLQFTL